MAVDGSPILRQLSTRVDDFFGRLVGPMLIILHPPAFDDGLRIGNRHELMHRRLRVRHCHGATG